MQPPTTSSIFRFWTPLAATWLQAATGDTFRAACLAAWLAGRSADRLIDSGLRSVESLTATKNDGNLRANA